MFCPKCGNECVDEDICPNCDQDLLSVRELIEDDEIDTMVGRYEGTDGYIELSDETVTIHKGLYENAIEYTLSYDDLADIAFQLASEAEDGYLVLYGDEDIHSLTQEEWEEMEIIFDESMNRQFLRLYDFLQLLLQEQSTDDECDEACEDEDTYEIQCPECGSISFCATKIRSPRLSYRSKSLIIEIIRLCLQIVWFIFYRKKYKYCCNDCGHEWVE